MKTKIHWTPEEVDLIATEASHLLQAYPKMSYLDAIRSSQQEHMPTSRIRELRSISQVGAVVEAMHKAAAVPPPPPAGHGMGQPPHCLTMGAILSSYFSTGEGEKVLRSIVAAVMAEGK